MSSGAVDRRAVLKAAGAIAGGGVGGSALVYGSAAEAAPALPTLRPGPEASEYLRLHDEVASLVRGFGSLPDEHPDAIAGQAAVDACWERQKELAAAIYASPLSLQGIIDRGVIAWTEYQDRIDGTWFELTLDAGITERSAAELTLAVAMLAGVTNGRMEREGDPSKRWWEQPVCHLRLSCDSLAPEYRIGDEVIVEKAAAPEVGAVVLVKPRDYHPALLYRVTAIDGDAISVVRRYGQHNQYEETAVVAADQISGTVVEQRRKLGRLEA